MDVRDVARQYFACVDAHDAQKLSQLFAEDAWLRPPPPVKDELHGRDQIKGFYAQLFTRAPDIRIDPDPELIADGSVSAARFSSWTNGRHNQHVLDLFRINDKGELIEMTAYAKNRVE